ncbi:hypothetical protein KL951_002892 [Ogataea haglerorum]|nr:hypothetical protein KL951_002892 [Ogataea haglerorum]
MLDPNAAILHRRHYPTRAEYKQSSDFIRYMNDCIKEVCADGAVSALAPFVTVMSAVASFAGKAVWAFRQPQNCIHRFSLIVCGIHHHPSRSSDYEYRFRLGGADMVN